MSLRLGEYAPYICRLIYINKIDARVKAYLLIESLEVKFGAEQEGYGEKTYG